MDTKQLGGKKVPQKEYKINRYHTTLIDVLFKKKTNNKSLTKLANIEAKKAKEAKKNGQKEVKERIKLGKVKSHMVRKYKCDVVNKIIPLFGFDNHQ